MRVDSHLDRVDNPLDLPRLDREEDRLDLLQERDHRVPGTHHPLVQEEDPLDRLQERDHRVPGTHHHLVQEDDLLDLHHPLVQVDDPLDLHHLDQEEDLQGHLDLLQEWVRKVPGIHRDLDDPWGQVHQDPWALEDLDQWAPLDHLALWVLVHRGLWAQEGLGLWGLLDLWGLVHRGLRALVLWVHALLVRGSMGPRRHNRHGAGGIYSDRC